MTIYSLSWCPEPILQDLSFLCKKKKKNLSFVPIIYMPIAADQVSENTLYTKSFWVRLLYIMLAIFWEFQWGKNSSSVIRSNLVDFFHKIIFFWEKMKIEKREIKHEIS